MDKLEDKPAVGGIMSSWLQSKTDVSDNNKKEIPAVKKKSDRNPIMTNWLKRGRNNSESDDKPSSDKNIKLC